MHNEFKTHVLTETGRAKATAIAKAFDELLTKLEEINPLASREMAVCRTKLEEASFFAKKAMASNPENGSPA